jgi:ankyrin repeat protein
LHLNSLNGNLDFLRLVYNKINSEFIFEIINTRDVNGQTPLHLAAINGNDEIIHFFSDINVDLNHADLDGNNILHLMIENNEIY